MKKAGWPVFWSQRGLPGSLLLPLSWLFSGVARWRRARIVPHRLPVPVVVVGGITVGGAGKTPLTLYLVDVLRQRGYVPGIVSRGYGGSAAGVVEVMPDSSPEQVGDEPLLLSRRAGCPVVVGADRVAAGHALLAAHPDVNLVLCDDGMQHYRLARDVEIAVLDRRGVGNGHAMPAGPLRESPLRLREVDALVLNDVVINALALPVMPPAVFSMRLQGDEFRLLNDGTKCASIDFLKGKALHAVAGIGEPQRFFDHLASLGLSFTPHAFPDHHAYTAKDVAFDGTILTTEKDAVKLRSLPAMTQEVWVLPVTAVVSEGLDQLIVEKLHGRAPA